MTLRPPPPRLVDDLIPVILDSSQCWWPRDLSRLARVSSAWLHPVRKRLYACPAVYTLGACVGLADTLSRNPSLLALLTSLELCPTTRLDEAYESRAKFLTSLRFLLQLDNLQRLTLGGELAVGAERFLKLLADTEGLTYVCIIGGTDASNPGSLEWDEVLAMKIWAVTHLRLINLELTIIPPSIDYQSPLRIITLDCVSVVEGFLPHLLNEGGTLLSLSVFTKSTTEYEEQIAAFFSTCGANELIYEARDRPQPNHLPFVIGTHSEALQKLALKEIKVDHETLTSLNQNCPNMEVLTVLGKRALLAGEELADLLRVGGLSRLRLLRTYSGEALVEACMYRSIEFEGIL